MTSNLLVVCANKKGHTAGGTELLARAVRLAGSFPRAKVRERGDQVREPRGRGNGNVMRAENSFHLRGERGEPRDGSAIRVEIGLGAEKPDGRGIVGVAGEE